MVFGRPKTALKKWFFGQKRPLAKAFFPMLSPKKAKYFI
jgi:hypothetical protein